MRIILNGLACLVISLFFFFSVETIFAASISYSSSSQTFSNTDEIPLNVKFSISASDETTYYLRGVFYKDGSSNYCGLTWNGNAYYSGPYTTNDGWKNFLKVSVKDNNWEGEVKIKIDSEDSGCKESGVYKMKLERFTETGSGTFDSQEPLSLTFILPTPTPSPVPTAKPTPTVHIPLPTKNPTPTKNTVVASTQSSPTSSTVEVLTKIVPTSNPNYTTYESSNEAVLGDATESAEELMSDPSATPIPVKVLGSSFSIWPFILSTIGGGIVILCGILAFRAYKSTILR